jgi:hypothetical protein
LIKTARAREENLRTRGKMASSRFGTILPSDEHEDRFVWLLHGSREQADYTRKRGHGTVWKHKYKVLDVRPHAVLLEIPGDGSVPRVNPWQLIRRVVPAHAGDHAPDNHSPVITEFGVRIPDLVRDAPAVVESTPTGGDSSDPLANPYEADDTLYELENDAIEYAERIGTGREVKYKLWLKYKGATELYWRYAHHLRRETKDKDLLRQINKACAVARARQNGHVAPTDDEVERDIAGDTDDDPGQRGNFAGDADGDFERQGNSAGANYAPGPFPAVDRRRGVPEGVLPPRTLHAHDTEGSPPRRAVLRRDARPARTTRLPDRYTPVLTMEVCASEDEYLHSVLDGLVLLLEEDFAATTTLQEDQALVNWLRHSRDSSELNYLADY